MPIRKSTASIEALLLKYNELISKPSHSTTANSFSRLEELSETFAGHGLEVRQWQDGTRSSFGDRPTDCGRDLWLPAQLKTTTSKVYPFRFKGCGELYPIVALTGNVDEAFLYSPAFVGANASKLMSTGNGIRNEIKVTSGSRNQCVWNIPRMSLSDVANERLKQWHDELSKFDAGMPSILRSERTLRMDSNCKSRCEFLHTELSMFFDKDATHSWAPPQRVYDRMRDNVAIQDKPAVWNSNTDSARYTALITKRLNGGHIPYELGDLNGGMFVMSTIHVGLRLFLEWRIPEIEMDCIFEALLHRGADDKFCTAGCQCINLSVIGERDENKDLHMKIFGRMPQHGADRRAAAFLHVYELPSEYSIDPCLEGRDPIPKSKRKRGE